MRQFFKLNVLKKAGGINSIDEIQSGLVDLLNRSTMKGQPIGLMTAENRNKWAKCYNSLHENTINAATLATIHTSLFVVCLDESISEATESNTDDVSIERRNALNSLHGGGHKQNSANRWFDKTLQLIVSRDGACGLNYEHTSAEGPPIIRLMDHTIDFVKAPSPTSSLPSPRNTNPTLPVPLEFSLDRVTRDALDMAKTNMQSLVGDLELNLLQFVEFGKRDIKVHKLSPDAFIQIAFQLAYQRMYSGVGCATYESCSIRRFLHGRTETIRSCSNESLNFSQAMMSENSTWDQRLTLMVQAIAQHVKYSSEASIGYGIDRHLLGLKLIAIEKGLELPKIFMDPTYSKAFHFNISTSQVSSKNNLSLSFGPVVPDGYGICYNPQNDKLVVTVTSYKSCPTTSSEEFAVYIRDAFRDMMKLLNGKL